MEQDSFIKKRMFSGRHKFGGLFQTKSQPPCPQASYKLWWHIPGASHLPRRLLGIPPGPCSTSLHTLLLRQLPQRLPSVGADGMGRVTRAESHLERGSRKQTGECTPGQDNMGEQCSGCGFMPVPAPQLLSKPATVSRQNRAVPCLWENG